MVCIATQDIIYSHTDMKSPNGKGHNITFSRMCTKRTDATREAPEKWGRKPAGRIMDSMGQTSGGNMTALGLRAGSVQGGERGPSGEEMADAEEGGVEAEDITMAENTMPMPTATLATYATANWDDCGDRH